MSPPSYFSIEKSQSLRRLELTELLRKVGKTPTVAESLDVQKRRQRLQQRVDQFLSRAKALWPLQPHLQPSEYRNELWIDLGDPDSEDDEDGGRPLQFTGSVENLSMYLPSTFGMETCTAAGYLHAADMEKALRIGQANDKLQCLRIAISRKACIFREGVRAAKSKKKKTRAWDHIHAVDQSVRYNCRAYLRARSALFRLNPSVAERERYQPLAKGDINVDTARIEPGLRGQRNKHLAWFWTMDISDDVEQQEGMTECE